MNNSINQILALVCWTAFFLIMLSFFGREIKVGNLSLRKINILSDILEDKLPNDTTEQMQPDTIPLMNNLDTSLFNAYLPADTAINIPETDTLPEVKSVKTESPPEKISYYTNTPSPSTFAQVQPSQIVHHLEDYTAAGNGLQMLLTRFDTLTAKGKKVRIAFWGDSLVEGDILVGYLRDMLQSRWGGNGVGFVSVVSPVAQFRASVKHTFSGNWKTHAIIDNKAIPQYMGISGYCHYPLSRNSWVRYSATTKHANSNSFNQVRLFYYNPANQNAEVSYTINKNEPLVAAMPPADKVQCLTIDANELVKTIEFRFDTIPGIWIYGASLEGNSGIYIDNFSVRGSAGTQLKRIKPKMFQEFNQLQEYSLLILQFGLNVEAPTGTHVNLYSKAMDATVAYIKELFPDTPIILFSVTDRCSVSETGEIVTAANLDKLLTAQRNIAKKHKIMFWDMYSAMGGKNAMLTYTQNGWANKDYTHLNYRGGKELAKAFSKILIN